MELGLTKSITALIYQRQQVVFACHMEHIQFQTTVSSVSEEGGEFCVARSRCHYLTEIRVVWWSRGRMNALHTEA